MVFTKKQLLEALEKFADDALVVIWDENERNTFSVENVGERCSDGAIILYPTNRSNIVS